MRLVNHYLTVEQLDRIEAVCVRTGSDRSAVIRAAIDAWLAKAEKERKGKP